MRTVICAIARMENHYIKEWVDYHLSLGFDHIFLYDNAHQGEETIDEVIDVETKYKGVVTIIQEYDKMHRQVAVYTECYNTQQFDWIAFIDIDEFITFAKDSKTGAAMYKDIHDFLLERADEDVIVLNWMTYGDSGKMKDNGQPLLDRLTKPMPYHFSIENAWGKQPFNCRVKSIYKKGLSIDNGILPHTSKGPFKTFNADKQQVSQMPIQAIITYENCYVRHFITKTLPEFVKTKVKRKDNVSGSQTTYRFPGFFLYNPPTFRRIYLYKRLCKEYGIVETMPIKWWIKQWIKHCVITPLIFDKRMQPK